MTVQNSATTTLQLSHNAKQAESPLPMRTVHNASLAAVSSPRDNAKETEIATVMRTLRHHYQLKVYLPLYRLLHLQTRRNDREEIRRKLAMGFDEDYYGGERVNKKPSLQTRLQGGMNLQICFVNEAAMADQTEAGGAPQDTAEAAPAQSMMQVRHFNCSLSLCIVHDNIFYLI